MTNIDDLPSYVLCKDDDCETNHYLTINRDLYGQWSAAYMSFEDGVEGVIPQLFINSALNLDEVALRMKSKLERYQK